MSPSVTKSRAAALYAKNGLSEPSTPSKNMFNNRKTLALLESTIAIDEEDEDRDPTMTPKHVGLPND